VFWGTLLGCVGRSTRDESAKFAGDGVAFEFGYDGDADVRIVDAGCAERRGERGRQLRGGNVDAIIGDERDVSAPCGLADLVFDDVRAASQR
jgi:hypothetical protein